MGLLKRSVANAACIVEIAIPLPTLPRLRGRGREGDGETGRLTNGCNAGQIRTGSSERTKGPDDAQLHCAPDQEKVFVELVLPESVCTKVCVRTRVTLIRARSGHIEPLLPGVMARLVPAIYALLAEPLQDRRGCPPQARA